MRYDPVRMEEQLFKQPVKWLVRNVELFVPLGTFVAKIIFDIQVRRWLTSFAAFVSLFTEIYSSKQRGGGAMS